MGWEEESGLDEKRMGAGGGQNELERMLRTLLMRESFERGGEGGWEGRNYSLTHPQTTLMQCGDAAAQGNNGRGWGGAGDGLAGTGDSY